MTPQEARKLFNVTPEQLDEMAKPYEDRTYESSNEPVIVGSHLDHVEKAHFCRVKGSDPVAQISLKN